MLFPFVDRLHGRLWPARFPCLTRCSANESFALPISARSIRFICSVLCLALSRAIMRFIPSSLYCPSVSGPNPRISKERPQNRGKESSHMLSLVPTTGDVQRQILNPTGRIEAGTKRSPPATSYYFGNYCCISISYPPSRQAAFVTCRAEKNPNSLGGIEWEGYSQPNCPFRPPTRRIPVGVSCSICIRASKEANHRSRKESKGQGGPSVLSPPRVFCFSLPAIATHTVSLLNPSNWTSVDSRAKQCRTREVAAPTVQYPSWLCFPPTFVSCLVDPAGP